MTNISIDRNWGSFSQVTGGDGTLSITGGVLNVYSTTAGRSYISQSFSFAPGTVVVFRCFGRVISGAGGRVVFDYPSSGVDATDVNVNSTVWKQYTLKYTIPYTATDSDILSIVVGSTYSGDGEFEFCLPELFIEGSSSGFARCRFAGLVTLHNQVPSINKNYYHTGITSVTWDDVSLEMTVNVDTPSGDLGMYPIINATLVPDQNYPFSVRAGGYSSGGSFTIKFWNHSIGSYMNPGGYAVRIFVTGFSG